MRNSARSCSQWDMQAHPAYIQLFVFVLSLLGAAQISQQTRSWGNLAKSVLIFGNSLNPIVRLSNNNSNNNSSSRRT